MIRFFLFCLIATIVGIQIGVYLVLRHKELSAARAFRFSFIIYLVPFVVVMGHLELFKNRHLLFQNYAKRKKLSKMETEIVINSLDTKHFLLFSVLMAIKDLITPKDNIIQAINIAEVYNTRFPISKRRQTYKKSGIIGMVKKAAKLFKGDVIDHAKEELFLGGYQFKH